MRRIRIHRVVQNWSFSRIAIGLVMLLAIWFQLFSKRWRREEVIVWDVISYYAYLPAAAIHHDLSLRFLDDNSFGFKYPDSKFWPLQTPEGRYVIKTTMGMAIMYSPFFICAHLVAQPLGYPPSGFSLPYQLAVSISALFYLLLALILLRRILRLHFSELATGIALILITIGTNLLWYATMEPGLSHVFSFFLFALFIYLLERWIERSSWGNTVVLGLLYGLIALVRPSNVLIGILFVLWNIASFKDIVPRISLLLRRWPYLFVMVLAAVVVWVPQIIYWKAQTGHFFYYSYSNERFFFLNPHLIDGFFGFRTGLLLYTPVIGFALAGLSVIHRYRSGVRAAIVVFFILSAWVLLSWWSWWYGGSYGHRAFIEMYALLVLPLAAFVQWVLERRWPLKMGFLALLLVLLMHSVFQTFQYYYGAIHFEAMTRAAYIDSFGRIKPSEKFKSLLWVPNEEQAKRGEDETTQGVPYDFNNPLLNVVSGAWDVEGSVRNIEQPLEFVEIFNRNIAELGTGGLVTVKIAAPFEGLPSNLFLAVAIRAHQKGMVYYFESEVPRCSKLEDFVWEHHLSNEAVRNVKFNVFFWSKEQEPFAIDRFKLEISGLNGKK